MNFFRFFQTGVIVGSLVVGVIFATFFIYHDAFFAALPSMFFGLYPILYFCVNCCHVGSALHRGKFFPNQWFRFTMEAFYLFFICAAFTMIILAAPLISVFDMASSSINLALMSFTASSLMFHFVQ